MPVIKFLKEKKTVEVPSGANLRKEAMKAGVEVYSGIHKVLHCPGLGMCTTCKMRIRNGVENVSPQGFWEKLNMMNFIVHPITFISRLGIEKELRLACQTKVLGDVEVETRPEFNWHGERFWG
jgi:ferredoxin